jgi:hypothetical protein
VRSSPEADTDKAEIYRKFIELLEKNAGEMNEFLFEVEDRIANAHFSHLKLMVGKVLGHGHMPVLEEICQNYPVLKRDWMK